MAFNTRSDLCLCAILLAGLAAGQTFPDLSQCDKNVGCFRFPATCTPAENCTSVLMWRTSNDPSYITFDLMAVTDGWVAVAFSWDALMGDDSVVDCIRDNRNNSVKVGFSRNYESQEREMLMWNEPYTPNSTMKYLKDDHGSYVNGFIVCRFDRLISGDNYGITSLNNNFYLLLGFGPAEAGVKQQHQRIPHISHSRVNVVMDFMNVSSSQPPPTSPSPDLYSCSQPMNCVADGRGSQVTFDVISGTNQVLITMTRMMNESSGWLGLGFSNDTVMANDSVIDCILLNNGTMTVKHSFNGNHSNSEISNATEGIANASLSNENGLLQCSFLRQIDNLTNSQIFSLDEPYYLFLAYGPVSNQGRKRKHFQKFITPYAITVTSNFSAPRAKSYFADERGNYVAYKYLADSDEVKFEVKGPVTEEGRWIALGFSYNAQMGNDSCLDCILLKNGTIIVQHSYNADNPKSNSALNSTEGITLIETSYKNGSLSCSFKRRVSGFTEPLIFSLDKPYFLLLGGGQVDDSGTKVKHVETPVISANPVDFRVVGNVTSGMQSETTPSNPPASTETPTPSNLPSSTETPTPSKMSSFTDSATNNEVQFWLSEDGTEVYFRIQGIRTQAGWWIAVGFSDDQKMGNDSVLDCISTSNETFRVQISYNIVNKDVKNEEVGNPDSAISDITTASINGTMACNFKRKISGFSDSRIFPFTQPFYLLLASGQLKPDGTKDYHQSKVSSPTKFNLTTNLGQKEPVTPTPSNPPSSTETSTPSKTSRFTDSATNNEVQFHLSEDGTQVYFTIQGPRTQDGWWIAVGFSGDGIMGNDSVLDCISPSSGSFRVLISYNKVGRSNEEVGNPDSAISDITTSVKDGVMTCNFYRKISGFSDSRIFPFTELFRLLLASGPVKGDGTKDAHKSKVASNETFNITTTVGKTVSGGGRRHSNAPDPIRLLRAHGVLMITAFVMLLSGAIILARYYKTCWPENKICGTAVWFAVHRFLMVIGLFCCASGFIIVFCYGDGYIYRDFPSNYPSYFWAHGPMGIVVMILIIINPIMALFRCDPDHDLRWIYNWLHFIVGMSCQILAGITLFFGMKMGEWYSLNHMAVFWLLIAFVAFHCFIEIILIIEKIITQRQTPHSFTINYGMTTPGEEPTAVKEGLSAPTRESLMFRYFVLALYTTITMGLWLAMIILVGGSFHTDDGSRSLDQPKNDTLS